MSTRTSWIRRTPLRHVLMTVVATVVPILVAVAPASAQTAEGTVITNVATASFTDANGNTYSDVTDSSSVTVGFSAGVDVVAGAATAAPASPSTGNSLTFTLDNVGNGTDSLSVGVAVSDGTVVQNVSFEFNSTSYADEASLNAALAGYAVSAGGTITVTVLYDVPSGKGNQTSNVTLTGTSRRDGTTNDAAATAVTPPLSGSVTVTPDGGQNVKKLPSNGTSYSVDFSVTNTMNGSSDFDLTASTTGGAIAVVSVDGTAGSTATLTGLGASASQSVTVVYTVGDVAAGTADTLELRAEASNDATKNDTGFMDLSVIRPSLTITKAAFRDDKSTAIGGGDTVAPGDYIQYRITVENTGTAPGESVEVTEALPAEVAYDSSSGDGGSPAWTLGESGGTVTGTLGGSLAVGASRHFWIRVLVN